MLLSLAALGLTLLGAWVVANWMYENLRSLVQIVVAVLTPYFVPAENKTLVERYGKWAVITGCTDGIGRQYAFQLAARGLNIVLISRTPEKLMAVAAEIEQRHQVKTKWIAADFSLGKPIFEKIRQELAGVPVGILVNNVGTNTDFPDNFENTTEDKLWEIMNVNIGAATMMTRLVLPEMKQRRQGAIVNISSGSELQPLPYLTIYAASKAYVRNFTLALQHEVEPHGITCQLVSPLYVTTKMNQYSSTLMEGGVFIPNAESYAKFAVFTLGKSKRTTGYWSHGIQYCAIKFGPEWLRTMIGGEMNKFFRKEYHDLQKAVKTK